MHTMQTLSTNQEQVFNNEVVWLHFYDYKVYKLIYIYILYMTDTLSCHPSLPLCVATFPSLKYELICTVSVSRTGDQNSWQQQHFKWTSALSPSLGWGGGGGGGGGGRWWGWPPDQVSSEACGENPLSAVQAGIFFALEKCLTFSNPNCTQQVVSLPPLSLPPLPLSLFLISLSLPSPVPFGAWVSWLPLSLGRGAGVWGAVITMTMEAVLSGRGEAKPRGVEKGGG